MTIKIDEQEKMKLIKSKLQTDRQFFFEFLLSHYIKTPKNPVGTLHREWFDLLSTQDKIGIIAPRGHSKSSIITVADNLFDICNHGITTNQPYIIIFSDTPEQAVEHLGNIVEELEGNELLIKFYGRLYEGRMLLDKKKEKWTQSTIVCSNGVKIIARGWRFRARGLRVKADRPSKIVIDDIENDEDVNSDKMRERLKKTFERKILNLGDRETKYRIVGTILHFDSLLQNEFDNPRPGWVWKLYKAYTNDKPIWEDWWSLERLEEKKAEIGTLAFEQEFMNNPIDPDLQIIEPTSWYEQIDPNSCDFYGYIDLAISEKESADYTAIVTIGRDKITGLLYVIDPIRIKGSIQKQLDLVFQQNTKYNYKLFGVESVAYQKAFYQLLLAESAKRNVYIPVTEVVVDKDKIRRVLEVTPQIENGIISFNKGYQDFLAELIHFPKGEHDDWVDAFVGAVKLALTKGGSSQAIGSHKTSLYPKNY